MNNSNTTTAAESTSPSPTEDVAGLAHDLRNQLTVLAGGLQLARERTGAERQQALRMLRVSAACCRPLLARMEGLGNGLPAAPATGCPTDEVIEQTLAVFRILLPDNIEFYRNVWATPWPVAIQAVDVGRILTNLLTNARDAMQPKGGILRVHLENHTVPAPITGAPWLYPANLQPGRYVRMVVADTGPGVPPEVAAQLFFNCITTKQTGTGFGLLTVFRLLKAVGGGIDFQTVLEQGARFNVYLPAVAPGGNR